MALLASTSTTILGRTSTPSCSWCSKNNASTTSLSAKQRDFFLEERPPTRLGLSTVVSRAAVQGSVATTTDTVAGSVTEVDKDTFWPLVEEAGDKIVVLDMYTQWCGPCKLMLPKIMKLSTEYTDVCFFKLDCNQHNKPLAKELGVRVVPTFKIIKDKQVVAEVAGAKFEELVNSIDKFRTE